jgi:hypothetical protein
MAEPMEWSSAGEVVYVAAQCKLPTLGSQGIGPASGKCVHCGASNQSGRRWGRHGQGKARSHSGRLIQRISTHLTNSWCVSGRVVGKRQ